MTKKLRAEVRESRKTLTVERLKYLLSYDPETGIWTRIVTLNQMSRKGTVAGTEHKAKRSLAIYIRIKIDGKGYMAHRLAFLYMTGSWPVNQPDHKNTIGTDNRWENLRDATSSQNIANKKKDCRNKSGFKGVYYSTQYQAFIASIKIRGKTTKIGIFDTAELASIAYERRAKEVFGEFARA
jgi:hypothetical protein